jgi:hypothetical protein
MTRPAQPRHHSPELQQIQRELASLGPNQDGAAACGCTGGASKTEDEPPVSRHPWDTPGGWEATLRSLPPRNPYAATEVVQAGRPSSPLVPEYLLESNVPHASVATSTALSRTRDLPRAPLSPPTRIPRLEIDAPGTGDHSPDAPGLTPPRPPPHPPHVPRLVTTIGDDDWEPTHLLDLDDPLGGYPVPSPWDFDLGLECEIHRPPPEPPPEPPDLGRIVQPLPPGVPPVLDHAITATPRATSTTHHTFGAVTNPPVPDSPPPPTTFEILGPEPPPPPPPQDFLGPGLPLCPPGYEFDYAWQSCWKKGEPPPPIPPGEPRYPHACRCPSPKETYLAPEDRCWVRGSLPHQVPTASADITLPVPPETEGVDSPCPGAQTWNPDLEKCGKPAACHGVMDCCWSDVVPQWKKPLTTCNSGNDKDLVTAAVTQAFAWIDPVYRMLKLLAGHQPEYVEAVWNFDYHKTSPKHWLAPYIPHHPGNGDFLLLMVREIVTKAWSRLSTDPVIIWCEKTCTHTTAWFHANTIHLCNKWFSPERTPADRAKTVLHEVFHFALPYWISNMPRDMKACSETEDGCSGGSDKCYGRPCAEYLAENQHITGSAWDQNANSTRHMPASLMNIDNYVYWCRSRFEILGEYGDFYEECALPPWAPLPE